MSLTKQKISKVKVIKNELFEMIKDGSVLSINLFTHFKEKGYNKRHVQKAIKLLTNSRLVYKQGNLQDARSYYLKLSNTTLNNNI